MAEVEQGPSVTLAVRSEHDAGRVRRAAREMAVNLGFGVVPAEEIAIAASELAMNLVRHARAGEMTLSTVREDGRLGLRLESRDGGPGIANIAAAMQDGFSTGGGLGGGLGGVRRMMDRFEISSSPTGTVATATKWHRPAR